MEARLIILYLLLAVWAVGIAWLAHLIARNRRRHQWRMQGHRDYRTKKF